MRNFIVAILLACVSCDSSQLEERLARMEQKVDQLSGQLVGEIDTDAAPYIPEGWEVVKHRKIGLVKWDPSKVKLHLEPEQVGGHIKGDELCIRFESQPVYNANMLDYLLSHPKLIPETWIGKAVFFWGTIYRADGRLSVRYLFWSHGSWSWHYLELDDDWPEDGLAALSVTS